MKNLRMFFLLTIFFVSFALSIPAQAQSLDGKKVGYVDLSRLFDEYQKTKDYDKVLEKNHQDYETERNKKLEKIRESQNKLSLLKDEEKAKLQSEIEKERADLLEFDRQKQTDLRKQRDDKLREILLEVEKVVKDFAEKQSYVFILNDRVLIFGAKEYDLTAQILKILNEGYKK